MRLGDDAWVMSEAAIRTKRSFVIGENVEVCRGWDRERRGYIHTMLGDYRALVVYTDGLDRHGSSGWFGLRSLKHVDAATTADGGGE